MRKPPKGIRRTKAGWRVYGRVGGRFFSKTFPAATAVYVLKDWRRDERARISAKQRAVDPLPGHDWKRLTPSADGWCYVYFIRAGERIKIGRTTDPGQRMRALQTMHHDALSLVLSIPAHAALEDAIHTRFAHLRERGEWFRIEPDLVGFIQAVHAGANPIALLW
jgi:hypothetical protein